jgi:hypothetical protein
MFQRLFATFPFVNFLKMLEGIGNPLNIPWGVLATFSNYKYFSEGIGYTVGQLPEGTYWINFKNIFKRVA